MPIVTCGVGSGRLVVRDRDVDAMPRREVGDEAVVGGSGTQPGRLGERFGGFVEHAEVVVIVVEEVTDHVVWHQRRRGQRFPRTHTVGEGGELVGRVAVSPVDAHEHGTEVGLAGHQVGDLGLRERPVEVERDFLQFTRETNLIDLREEHHAVSESVDQLEQYRRGERPLIAFELVEVTGGDSELIGEHVLLQPELVAQAADAGPHVRPRHRSPCQPRMLRRYAMDTGDCDSHDSQLDRPSSQNTHV